MKGFYEGATLHPLDVSVCFVWVNSRLTLLNTDTKEQVASVVKTTWNEFRPVILWASAHLLPSTSDNTQALTNESFVPVHARRLF